MIFEFANSADPFEVAHHEPPHPDLHYFPYCLHYSEYDTGWTK